MKRESVMVTRRLLLPQPPGDVGTSRCRSASSTQSAELAAPSNCPHRSMATRGPRPTSIAPLEVNLECR